MMAPLYSMLVVFQRCPRPLQLSALLLLLVFNARAMAITKVTDYSYSQTDWLAVGDWVDEDPVSTGILTGSFSGYDFNKDGVLSYTKGNHTGNEISDFVFSYSPPAEAFSSIGAVPFRFIDLNFFSYKLGQPFAVMGLTMDAIVPGSFGSIDTFYYTGYGDFSLPLGEAYDSSIPIAERGGYISSYWNYDSPDATTSPLRVQEVPEINGAGAPLTLALLAGIYSIVRERRKHNVLHV